MVEKRGDKGLGNPLITLLTFVHVEKCSLYYEVEFSKFLQRAIDYSESDWFCILSECKNWTFWIIWSFINWLKRSKQLRGEIEIVLESRTKAWDFELLGIVENYVFCYKSWFSNTLVRDFVQLSRPISSLPKATHHTFLWFISQVILLVQTCYLFFRYMYDQDV